MPSVTLVDTAPPVPLVGARVVWTAETSDHGTTPVYQFSVGPTGGDLQMVRDFSTQDTFTWDPLQEGSYVIQVTVKDSFGATTGESTSMSYTATSRVVGSDAVISPTSNPLVALYSAPPSAGTSMVVEYIAVGSDSTWKETSPQAIVPGQSTNVIVAGLLPDTTYWMRHVLDDGTTSAPLSFTTGSLPSNLTFPTFATAQAPVSGADTSQDMILHIGVAGPTNIHTVATDLSGNIDWYYDEVANGLTSLATSLVPGGTVLLLGGQGYPSPDTLREINLAGDTLRETNIDAVNAELAALGKPSIINFNHDAERLPNGDTAVLAGSQRTIDLNGVPTTYVGDMVIVLDQNFQVAWVWDSFAWLDTNRLPTLGEGPGDWTHANSIAWSPADGNLLVSLRSQDWVVKIDYSNGAGDGHVIWRLGQGGDFTIDSSDPSPWFSHQHDVRYINDTTLVLFDDGNVRQATDPDADSRGQELVLDETTMRATLVVNVDLGIYSGALGSAQMLPDGNLAFTPGFLATSAGLYGETIEVAPDGKQVYVQSMDGPYEYRSYFMSSLYGPSAASLDSVAKPGDFDGDGKTDIAGFVPESSTFIVMPSSGAFPYPVQFGPPGATVAISGDFDGDGKTDIAGFIPELSVFIIMPSSGAPPYAVQFGPPGATVPIVGDFDGDGRADIAGFVPESSTFIVMPSSGAPPYAVQFGPPGATVPIVGDFDGDGRADIAGFVPESSTFIVMPSSGAPPYAVQFGPPGATVPIVGDFDGDGKTDIAGFVPESLTFIVMPSSGIFPYPVQFGPPGATVPVTGDFDGDGRTDFAGFVPESSTFIVMPSSGAFPYPVQFGPPEATVTISDGNGASLRGTAKALPGAFHSSPAVLSYVLMLSPGSDQDNLSRPPDVVSGNSKTRVHDAALAMLTGT